ncbi:hypothetical protein Pfra02_32470 [Pseudomonas fragi]|nr:hypothetical protein Pfra02_32470 [Pseudomonas fragi]
MKTEHKDIIERAKRHNMLPMDIAHELMVHDPVEAALFEVRNVRAAYHSLNEGQQQEVIDRMTEAATKAVYTAISIISSRNVDTIPVTVVDAKFKAKAITVTAAIDAQDPNRHGLIDVAGKLCLLVLAPNDYAEGLDGINADRDQKILPLHVSELTGSLFGGQAGADEPGEQRRTLGTAEELAERTGSVVRVADPDDRKEFGEYTYEDAAQLIVLKAVSSFGIDWMQSRLAISSEQATTLLLRLIDNQVVELLIEGDTSADNTYTVIATLADLGPNLSVE